MIMTNIQILLLLMAAYRYAGMDMPLNKEVWGLAVAIAALILGLDPLMCVITGSLAYASRQWISHGEVYSLVPGSRQAGPWWSICCVRALAVTIAAGVAAWICALVASGVAFVCVGAVLLTRRLQAAGYIKDMVSSAELMQGAAYGLGMCIVLRWGQ